MSLPKILWRKTTKKMVLNERFRTSFHEMNWILANVRVQIDNPHGN